MIKRERELRRWCKRNRWRFSRTKNGHVRLTHKRTGAIVYVSGTPGDRRAWANFERDARRAVEAAES